MEDVEKVREAANKLHRNLFYPQGRNRENMEKAENKVGNRGANHCLKSRTLSKIITN